MLATYNIVIVSIRETDSGFRDGTQYSDISQGSAKSPIISGCISTSLDMRISGILLGSLPLGIASLNRGLFYRGLLEDLCLILSIILQYRH